MSHALFDSKEMSTTGNDNDDSMRDMLLSSKELDGFILVLQAINVGMDSLPVLGNHM